MISKFLLKFVSFVLGCFFTYYLAQGFGILPVIASATIGLLASFIPNRLIHGPAYAGSFAGMCSSFMLEQYYEMLILGIFGAAIYLFLKERFLGFGGKLGTVAFLSVCFTYIFKVAL